MDISLKMEEHFNIRSLGSYGGVQALYRLMKGKATKKQVVDWLANQGAYVVVFLVIKHLLVILTTCGRLIL